MKWNEIELNTQGISDETRGRNQMNSWHVIITVWSDNPVTVWYIAKQSCTVYHDIFATEEERNAPKKVELSIIVAVSLCELSLLCMSILPSFVLYFKSIAVYCHWSTLSHTSLWCGGKSELREGRKKMLKLISGFMFLFSNSIRVALHESHFYYYIWLIAHPQFKYMHIFFHNVKDILDTNIYTYILILASK